MKLFERETARVHCQPNNAVAKKLLWPRVFWNVDVASVKPVKPCKPDAGQVIWTRGTNRWIQKASLNLLPMLYWHKQSTAIASWDWRSTNWAKQSCSDLFVWSWAPCVCCDTGLLGSCLRHCSFHGSEQECCKLHEYTRNHRKSCMFAFRERKILHMQQYNRTHLAHRVHGVPLIQTTVTIVDVSLEPHTKTTY